MRLPSNTPARHLVALPKIKIPATRTTFKANISGVYVFKGAAACTTTVTDPAGFGNNGMKDAYVLVFVNRGTANLTLATASAKNFWNGLSVASIVIPPKQSVMIAFDGEFWVVVSTGTTQKGGQALFNGTGAQLAFVIPHGLGVAPTTLNVTPGSAGAAALFSAAADATNITVTYVAAPAAGANNVVLYWQATA